MLTFPTEVMAQKEVYCNDRFSFCLQYPSTVLSQSAASANGDGVVLYTDNEQLMVNVSGIHNLLNTSIEDEYNLFLEHLKNEKPLFEIYSSNLEKDQFTILAASQDEASFYKTVATGEYFISLSIFTKDLTVEQSKTAIDNIENQLIFLVYP